MTRFRELLLASGVLLIAWWLGSCSATGDEPPGPTSTTSSSGGSTGSGLTGGAGGHGAGIGGFGAGGASQVFPAQPLIEDGAPADAPSLFGDPGSGQPTGGPCLAEPGPNALYPQNWLRPRFRLQPVGAQNLFELRFEAASQSETLVVYTDQSTWTVPTDLWLAIAQNVVDETITVTVRGAEYDGSQLVGTPATGSAQVWTVAPAEAHGAIVYWTTSGGSALMGFAVGDETVTAVLEPSQVQMQSGGSAVTCIGCHTSTPDGLVASFTAQAPWGNAMASIEAGTVGDPPAFLTAAAQQTLGLSPLGIHAYSEAHWESGDHVQITPYGAGSSAELIWIDLEAPSTGQGTAYDVLARTGDPRGAGSPAWSHDGETIVYVSTDAEYDGRLAEGPADLYAIPYADRQGGAATAVVGAAEQGLSEYYPALSPDDDLLAFNRMPEGGNPPLGMYDAGAAELYVLRWQGGTGVPVRLDANDPPACTGVTSPGIANSWAKWSPEVGQADGNRYYWLIFSSKRGSAEPQLYMTAVVRNSINEISTYGAIYLWNQPAGEANHTPAWDVFQLPPPT